MTKEERKILVNEVLNELKLKNLINASKDSYKSTEKILFSYNALPEALNLIETEIKQLENEAKDIQPPTAKSSTLILNERDGTYVYADETLNTRISELKQIAIKTKSQIRVIKSALKKVEDDQYYQIIPLYYFDRLTIENISEETGFSVGAISKHKSRLINKLKVYIFPDTFMKELA